ncbi:hypothetical protein GUJ93_ZPchr0007g5709 [Zizania palustris]|uniref:Uncharacterized protein n=1 Tax=Zizania palustris TaxID=103762 RepID=A0A8J5T4V3_ZIZPA|nr:hypothetical protein GUJ93_ZPchr0007g5709 [Zizania palustris]
MAGASLAAAQPAKRFGRRGARESSRHRRSPRAAVAFLADSSPAPSPPPSPLTLRHSSARLSRFSVRYSAQQIHSPVPCASPHCCDEFSSYPGSSPSYSGISAGSSCVSDSAQRGRPVDPLRVLAVVSSIRGPPHQPEGACQGEEHAVPMRFSEEAEGRMGLHRRRR